jgi:hypothetical protein
MRVRLHFTIRVAMMLAAAAACAIVLANWQARRADALGAARAAAVETPTAEPPAPPATTPPATTPPATTPPVTTPPVTTPPVTTPPVTTPTVDPPTVDPPTVDPPTVDPPSVDPPTVDPPTVDPPPAQPPPGTDPPPDAHAPPKDNAARVPQQIATASTPIGIFAPARPIDNGLAGASFAPVTDEGRASDAWAGQPDTARRAHERPATSTRERASAATGTASAGAPSTRPPTRAPVLPPVSPSSTLSLSSPGHLHPDQTRTFEVSFAVLATAAAVACLSGRRLRFATGARPPSYSAPLIFRPG